MNKRRCYTHWFSLLSTPHDACQPNVCTCCACPPPNGWPPAAGTPWWDVTQDNIGGTHAQWQTNRCFQQTLTGAYMIWKGAAYQAAGWANCGWSPPAVAPAPPQLFPPANATGLQLNLQLASPFSHPSDVVPGVSVYVIDPWNTSQATVQAMRGAGLLPVAYLR